MIRMLGGPELADQWHKLKPLVEQSLVHGSGSVTSHGLFIQCLGAVAQCWVRDGGVCITRYEYNEGNKQLAIVACTDTNWFNQGPEIMELLENFARETGCLKTVVYGRKGWKKVLESYGYSEPFTTLTKEL
jgi:hypothetical protein|tara:strand:- start:1933 stop:2325 length:393 start_codon:yes stop_codon:yes gene_type:complete